MIMERIYLSQGEKDVLRMLVFDTDKKGALYDPFFEPYIDDLESKRLVRCTWVEGHHLDDITITQKGRSYLITNPKLRNPINWAKIAAYGAWITAIATIIGLFIACSFIKK